MKSFIFFLLGLIAGPILFAIAAVLGLLPSNSTANPPHWESSLGMRALDASLAKRSAGVKNPVQLNDAGALVAGRRIYASNCSGCHGGAKGPSAWGSRNFYPRVPQFFQEGTDVGPDEAYAAVRDGVRYSGMAAWRGQLTEQQMWQVANFVAQIDANGAPTKKMD